MHSEWPKLYGVLAVLSAKGLKNILGHPSRTTITGNKLERDVGDKVSRQAQTSLYFQLREKFKCIEHIDKSETQLKTSH